MRGAGFARQLDSPPLGASGFGLGAAHLRNLTRQTAERGFRVFDFTIGDEPYKRKWCETELTLFDHISVATLRGALVAVPLLAPGAAQAQDQADAGIVERIQQGARGCRIAGVTPASLTYRTPRPDEHVKAKPVPGDQE